MKSFIHKDNALFISFPKQQYGFWQIHGMYIEIN